MRHLVILGTFDGVHRGHQSLIKAAAEKAKENGMKSHILYFEMPPKFYFSQKKDNCVLTTPEEKKALLKSLGCDIEESLKFDKEIADISAEDYFLIELLKKRNAGGIAAGHDFYFGKNRKGDIKLLRSMCKEYGLVFMQRDFLLHEGQKISSSLIRQYILSGNMYAAAECLGRPYQISGKVQHGAGIGRTLGFPTANIDVPKEKKLPTGVYAALTVINGREYPSVAVIGRRPTLNTLDGILLPETHLIDFDGDLYGQDISLKFISKIRDEQKFQSKEQLTRQIAADKETARETLKKVLCQHF